MAMPAHVVWLKRDLRLTDHPPLTEAVRAAERDGTGVVVLYVYEPELLESPEWHDRHSAFIDACLEDMECGLRDRGARITYMRTDACGALDEIAARLGSERGLAGLWSHQETGNDITFRRDRRVAAWCARTGTTWREFPQHGVFRGLSDRDGWAARWSRRMRTPPIPAPERVPCVGRVDRGWDFGARLEPTRSEVGLPEGVGRQRGGEAAAGETLRTFLAARGVNYRADMSSPVTGFDGCSRLSPHLAWGSLSVRQAHHALRARQSELRAESVETRDPRWLKSLSSFQSRLRWRCHFIQKLETEPAIEFQNMSRAYDGLRNEDESSWGDDEQDRFRAWADGRTGYPFIDACMRCLSATGWMNFRMRSMLVSFASHHLWLDWRPTARHLARLFTDFEPGIHYSQMQMQSGTTGINTVRIYNPIKQGRDQDPTGDFIRSWVPELSGVRGDGVHEPAPMGGARAAGLFGDEAGGRSDYPGPIVEHAAAYRAAQRRIFAVRGGAAARAEARRVYQKHGSRRRTPRGR